MTLSAWQFDDLQMFGSDVVVADPPWDFQNYSDAGTLKGADPHYSVMTLDAIKALRVGELARSACLLLLWATECMRPQAHAVMSAWGFEYKTAIIWRKVTRNGKPRIGTGYRARTMHEPVLIGTIGNPKQSAAFPSIFDGVAREHSRKPDEFYELVIKHTPRADRCDLFSRQTREGFAGWGNERGKFDTMIGENT
jgi:N6-adenosine-specific RNA methylase IME4